MSEKIRVKIVDAGGANLQLRFTDPTTGKVTTSTKYTDPTTGEVYRTSKNRKTARKYATLLEADLNAGRTGTGQATSWQSFRERYENEVLPTLSYSVLSKATTVFNTLEQQFPKVANGKLSYLDSSVISRYQANLRERKLGETTITNYLATLRSALSWAYRQKLINAIPNIEFPKMGRNRGGYRGKGRGVNAEEFDRMLDKVEAALIKSCVKMHPNEEVIASWKHLMFGLWLSGLRISESFALSWDADAPFAVDLTGKHPRFRIRAEAQKARRDETLPMTPDFATFLLETPERQRRGRVFRATTNFTVYCS